MNHATMWTSHIKNPEHKKLFLEGLSHQFRSPQWQRLVTLIQDKINADKTKQVDSVGYEDPSWAYRQADHNGYQRALKEVLQLIPSDQKELK
jgi:hypothetical protein